MIDLTGKDPIEGCMSFAVAVLEELAAYDLEALGRLIDIRDFDSPLEMDFPTPDAGVDYCPVEDIRDWWFKTDPRDDGSIDCYFSLPFTDSSYEAPTAEFRMIPSKNGLRVQLMQVSIG